MKTTSQTGSETNAAERSDKKKYSGMSRLEQAVLLLTAGFLLFTGGWFLAEQNCPEPYPVTVTRSQPELEPAVSAPPDESRPETLLEGEIIDLNTADVYDLQRLPGIGAKRAQDIVDWRETNGPFQTVDELVRISGIGEKTLEGLRPYAGVGDPS